MMLDMFALLREVIGVCALALPLLFSGGAGSSAKHPSPTSHVPFVGCKSDGQMGPLAAPKGTTEAIEVSAELVSQLAYSSARRM